MNAKIRICFFLLVAFFTQVLFAEEQQPQSIQQTVNWTFSRNAESKLVGEITNYDWNTYSNLWKDAQNIWAGNGAVVTQPSTSTESKFNIIEGLSLTQGKTYKILIDVEMTLWNAPTVQQHTQIGLGSGETITYATSPQPSSGRHSLEYSIVAPATTTNGFLRVQTGLYNGQFLVHSVRVEEAATPAITFTAGQTVTFTSQPDNYGLTHPINYVANGDESLRYNASVPGFETELHLMSPTSGTSNSLDTKGYFILPLSYGARKVKGTLTITGGDKGNGELKVYAETASQGHFLQTVYINKNAASSTEVTIPANTSRLIVEIVQPACVLGITWQVKDQTAGDGENDPVVNEKFTLTYDANGATSGSVPAAAEYTKNAEATIAGNTGNLVRDGYTFGGWQINRTGDIYGPDTENKTLSITANTTLYAVWVPVQYSVSYSSDENGTLALVDAEGGVVASGSQLPLGTTLLLRVLPNEGYVLDALMVNDQKSDLINGSSILVESNMTLSATFRQKTAEDVTTTVGSAENSSWFAQVSPFVSLTTGQEIEFTFQEHATNEWYHSWALEISTDGSHHADWNENAFLLTSPKMDAYSPWSNYNGHSMQMYEQNLYNLQTGEKFSRYAIPSAFYQDTKNAKVRVIVTTDGQNTYVHALMVSTVDGNTNRWLYTIALKHDLVQTLHVAVSHDNSYLTNLAYRTKPSHVVTTACEPAVLFKQANVRFTTPEGVVLPSGIRAGEGDHLIAQCDEIPGYTFLGWENLGSDNPLAIQVGTTDLHLKAMYRNNNIPVISAAIPDELIIVGQDPTFSYGVSSNSPAPVTLVPITKTGNVEDNQIIDPAVSITLVNNLLTIQPHGSGRFSFLLHQDAAAGFAEVDKRFDISWRVPKTHLEVSPSVISVAKGSNDPITQPTVKLYYVDAEGVSHEIENPTLTFESLDKTLVNVDNNNQISFVSTATPASTDVLIKFDPGFSFEPCEVRLHMVVNDPAATTPLQSGATAPAVGSSFFVGAGDAVKCTYGGWKWNNHTYQVDNDSRTDAWDYLVGEHFGKELVRLDGFNNAFSGTHVASDEALAFNGIQFGAECYGQFEVGKPYTLPVRGSYMTFEPTTSGLLTVYLMQDGAFSYYGAAEAAAAGEEYGSLRKGYFRPVSYFVVDENGANVPIVAAVSHEKINIPDGYNCTKEYASEQNNDASTNIADWAEFRKLSDDEQDRIIAAWSTGVNDKQQIITLDNGSYFAVQKSIVRYTFPVVAGETYYVFSNTGQLAYAGASFTADAELHLADALSLNDASAYVAPQSKQVYSSISVNRNFTADRWSTITLPFYMTPSEVATTFGEGTQLIMLEQVSEGDNDRLHLQFVLHEMQGILAGYPYLIYPKANVPGFSVTKKQIDPAIVLHPVAVGEGYTHTPLLTTASMLKGDIYMGGSGALSMASGTKPVNVKGYRSYIKAPVSENLSSAPLRSITMEYRPAATDKIAEGDATAIPFILEDIPDANTSTQDGLYNLNGTRATNKVHGIYIQDGKVILVR